MLDFSVNASADGYTQNTSFSETNTPLEKEFREINGQTGNTFVYSIALFQKARPVASSISNAPIKKELDVYFQDLPLDFTKINNTVVNIIKKEKNPNMEQVFISPAIDIQGKVTTDKGEMLAGASIKEKGTDNATLTKADGSFSIKVAGENSILIISFVGYEPEEVTVGNQGVLSVQLIPQPRAMNEVTVIGYGTARKKDLTGSIATVTAKDFQKGVITTPDQLIKGKVAGVSITSNGGAPGAGSTIRIRGGASLNASNDPLIVIDGVPVTNSSIAGAANPLSLINPADIESFSILKDASAAAIYGNRATNGVILITTKKGASGKAKINFSTSISFANLAKKAPVFSPDEFRDFITSKDTTATGRFKSQLGTANTDWQDEIFRTALATDNNLGISGAIKKLPYRISIGYLNQEGILKTSSAQRLSGDLKLSPTLFDNHLKVNLNLRGAQVKQRFANETAIANSLMMNPTQPVFSGNNRFGGYFQFLDPSSTTGLKQLAVLNPVALLDQREDKSTVYRSIGNLQLDYKFHFLPDLHANLNIGYDIAKSNGTIFVPDSAASAYNRYKDVNNKFHGGINTQYKQAQTNKVVEGFFSYSKVLKSINGRLDAVAGSSYQDFITNNTNYPDRTANDSIVSSPKFPFDKPQYRLISFYGRVNYVFNEKYILTGTVRYDGSSRFSRDNRWGAFPSGAFAWNMKEEEFLKNSSALSNLKLRIGYGVTGQQEGIGNYDYISYYNLSSNTAQYQFGNTFYNAYRPGGFFLNRTWEQTEAFNAGFDYGFSNNRFTGTIDYFNRKTKDLLNTINQPAGTNFSNTILANVGNMITKGVEFSLNAGIIRTKDLQWDVSFNATFNTNKITKLTIVPDSTYPGQQFGIQINSVGYPKGSFYVYQQKYDAKGKPLEGEFEDQNKDGVINTRDLYWNKSPDPKAYFGLSSNVGYKKWNAGFAARASLGNYVYNSASNNGVLANFLNNFGIQNGSTSILETGYTKYDAKTQNSDYYIQKASFLRMDNINVGYNAGNVFQNAANLRISATVQNVFVITPYNGPDPEVAGGSDNNFYPRPRTYVLGLSLNF